MRILFQGDVRVSYRQLYVQNSDPLPEGFPDGAWAGQENGLCGAAYPGLLFLTTGLHTGNVGFTVESHDQTPPIDDSWEEIVEVSFTPGRAGGTGPVGGRGRLATRSRAGESSGPGTALGAWTPASGRPTAVSAGEPDSTSTSSSSGPSPSVRIGWCRQTSADAAYWHRFAREQPPPPPPRSPRRDRRA